ncbi:hypothetical protein DFH07DRAFT_970774 [Mycena maculata]|uniref:Uncharacterized protein n=1 Tax=Mycena maculata TaxID=230809 RepID=A0AAD7HPX2_9AGAR|nr:hypothetical protein DFH07DRAFT_970774 [Mycena maculata]
MKISKAVTAIVSVLGGPDINPEDIHWAEDLPAGRKLFEWLGSQVQLELAADGGMSDSLRAALQAISLEDEELQMLTRKGGTLATAGGQLDSVLSQFIPPWRLRAKEEYMGAEATRLETGTEVLKSRIHQTKLASQSLSQAIKAITSEIEKTDKEIHAAEDRLSELSINADSAILASVSSSLAVLDAATNTAYDHSMPEKTLMAASSTHNAITDRFRSQMRAIDVTAGRLPTPSEMQAECSRLDAALNTPRAGGKSLVADAAFNLELANLCQKLEDPETSNDALAAVLATDVEQPAHPPSIDVKAQLEHAWALDQAALLEARGAVLDEAIAAFSDTALPRLTALHDELSASDAHMREAHALVGALCEEIEDIIADARTAREPRAVGVAEHVKDAELQAGLTSLLNGLKDLRPRDAPPLVLLDQEDILNELRRVFEHGEDSRRREAAWAVDLLPTLRRLETAHAPLLDTAYAHSPMNASPPFSLPPDVQMVQADAKLKSDDLGNAVAKLQEHFVAKWAK